MTADEKIAVAAHDLPVDRLTPRQRQVLELLAVGATLKSAAGKLGISPKSVETHKAALYRRTGIDHVAGLVCYAIRQDVMSAYDA